MFLRISTVLLLLHFSKAEEFIVDMYNEINEQGFEYSTTHEIADLSDTQVDNDMESVCLLGVWIFYENTFFNLNNPGTTEAIMGGIYGCTNLEYGNTVSSVRFAGNGDTNEESITVYSQTNFEGYEYVTERDNIALSDYFDSNQLSYIIIGESPWTLYSGIDFSGEGFCVFPNTVNNGLSAGFVREFSEAVPLSSVQSIKKGCFA